MCTVLLSYHKRDAWFISVGIVYSVQIGSTEDFRSCSSIRAFPTAMFMADYSKVDYLEEALSSIALVEKLSEGQQVQLNPHQCKYLSAKLTETECFLRAKSFSLIAITDSADIRRKALLHLHFAVKRAERLVRGCCCETEPWLESAVTLVDIKEDVVDILLDLGWFTSMVDIAIASATRMSSGSKIERELLRCAEEDFTILLGVLLLKDNDLQLAANKDMKLLLGKVLDVETSYVGIKRSAEQNHDYLLAAHVRSRLENSELETMKELNVYEAAGLIGMGSFGAVFKVNWLGRSCAVKVLKYKCAKEAAKLSECQHPHIIKFFRYWETSFGEALSESTPDVTPHASSNSGFQLDKSREPDFLRLQSHIMMELMPTDLAQYIRCRLDPRIGSKRWSPPKLEVDVAIDVMLQVCKAVLYLNNKDIAHRDLKPSNVLVRPVSKDEVPELSAQGYLQAKLADFGLAKAEAMSSVYTTMTQGVGTRMYRAPEVFPQHIFSGKKFPRKLDVWSFGIMFCEILSGEQPFSLEDGIGELHSRIRKGLRPRLPKNCPGYLKFIISSCCKLRPQDRPNFSDLLRLIRLAQVRSLGLIKEDHDLFTYSTRESVVRRLHSLKGTPAPGPIVQSQAPLMSSWLRSFSSRRIRKAVRFFSGKWYLHCCMFLH